MSNILVIYEIREQKIKKISFEATSAAIHLAKEIDGSVSVLLIGSNIQSLLDEPGKYGAQRIYVVDKPELEKHSPDVCADIQT